MSTIGRTVVYNNQLKVRKCLINSGLNRLYDKIRGIIRGRDNCDPGTTRRAIRQGTNRKNNMCSIEKNRRGRILAVASNPQWLSFEKFFRYYSPMRFGRFQGYLKHLMIPIGSSEHRKVHKKDSSFLA